MINCFFSGYIRHALIIHEGGKKGIWTGNSVACVVGPQFYGGGGPDLLRAGFWRARGRIEDRELDSNNTEINKYYGFPLPWY